MLRHLVNHALQNVWCSPRQDNLHILQLHRLTAQLGVLTDVMVQGRVINLPNTKNRFHVYQIGQISAKFLGALSINPNWLSERWTSFSTAINATNTQIDIYTDKGVMIPRYRSYYMMTKNRNLIVALEINPRLKSFDLDEEDVYIRFYKNAKFTATAGSAVVEKLYLHASEINNNSKLISLFTEYNKYKALDGYVTSYVNGYVVDSIDASTVKINDTVEFLYDSTIYKVITLDVQSLPVFNSTLDSCLKYIIHHKSLGEENINYQDDIDIDVVYKKGTNRFKGTYYHRNIPMSHRMITHRDYALPVDHVRRSMDYLKLIDPEAPKTLDMYTLKIKVKETTITRPLIFDNNRIFELYKLPDSDIVDALTGTNALVENWKASVLENSYYTAIMGMNAEDVTVEVVQKAYGYNSVTKIVADSPIFTNLVSSRKQATIPLAYRLNSEVYEYDSDGLMIGHSYIDNEDTYYALSNDCNIIEPIVGKAAPNHGDITGVDDLDIPAYDYRVYKTYAAHGSVSNQNWEDITGSSLYEIVDGKLKWRGPENDNHWLAVRSEVTFYARDYEVVPVNGVLAFKLVEDIDGEQVEMGIPRGEIDLFINGYSAINSLDYIIEFPWIYINNVSYLNRPFSDKVQNIHVRMTGFCTKNLRFNPIDDFGFVKHGALSGNHRFDIRDDKVLRITVDGRFKDRSELIFDETSSAPNAINSLNGKPYQIKDYVIPIRDLVDEDTYSYRAKSLVIDEAVSNYLTLKLPSPEKGPVTAIEHRYRVVSPFLARVVYKLMSDIITDDDIAHMVGDTAIQQELAIDEHLLRVDPIRDENRYSDDNVIVVPHYYNSFVTLSVYKLRFLKRVVQLYSQADIELSQFILLDKEL